jgi:pyruvate dehydrogenase (quinone)
VLAITGMQETEVLGTGYQQEVHLEKLYQDVAAYDVMVMVPPQIPALVDRAVRTSLGYRTVSHLTFPNDLQVADAKLNPWKEVAPARTPETAPVYTGPSGEPDRDQLARAAELLNSGDRVAMLVGVGAKGARAEVLEVAELLGSPIVKTLSGKASVPDDHPLVTGGLGLLGTRPSEEVMEKADTLLMVGTSFPYTRHLPGPEQVRTVQIDVAPDRAGNRMPTAVPLVADAAKALRGLVPMLDRKADRGYLESAQKAMGKWRKDMAALESPDRDPIQPQYLMRLVDRFATDDAILCSDSGTIATWAARHFDIRGGRDFYLSGNLASMAPGLPYTIGAQWAHPGRQCIAFVGDGGMAMLMAEFDTACRYGLPIKVVVNNNSSLGQILWEQMVLGYPEYGVRFQQPMNFAPFAESCGGLGLRVEKAADLEHAVRMALDHEGPALVDVLVNPNEPPLPGKVSYEQAKGFAQAWLRGQPHKATMASTLFRDKLDQLRS